MSQHDSSQTPTTIKIAAKDASQRNSTGGADPGPGDPNAAPSIAPQLVDIPDPPTSSQLVVKSTTGSKQTSAIPTLQEARSITGQSYRGTWPKSVSVSSAGTGGGKHSSSKHSEHSVGGSQAGPAASHPSVSAPREPTSSRPLTGPTAGSSLVKSTSTKPKSASSMGAGRVSVTNPATASTAMQADSGVVHDEDEEGEGELEQPEDGASLTGTPQVSPNQAGLRGSSAAGPSSKLSHKSGKPVSDMEASPATSGAGISKMSIKTSGRALTSAIPSDMASSSSLKTGPEDKKKKVTRFRYHKRITVRTSGKTSPSTIMDKVNKKDHKAGITPSTIEDMDPQELMKRAGIKGTNQTHWRVRLRQTKRLTKDGKTTTQTKVAYRDSEGNKRVKTSLSPFCKNCGKKLEECKCESQSES